MIPANKIKRISEKIHINYGCSNGIPPVKPLIIAFIGIGLLYLLVLYF